MCSYLLSSKFVEYDSYSYDFASISSKCPYGTRDSLTKILKKNFSSAVSDPYTVNSVTDLTLMKLSLVVHLL